MRYNRHSLFLYHYIITVILLHLPLFLLDLSINSSHNYIRSDQFHPFVGWEDLKAGSAEILFQSFLQEYFLSLAVKSTLRRYPSGILFLHTTVSPTLQGALKDGFGEAVVST